jgi:hypothetical protein
MGWQVTVYTAPMLGAAVVAFLLAATAFRSRDQRTALPLVAFLLRIGIWCATSGLRISSTTLAAKEFWRNIQFLGPTITVPSVLFFAAEFTNRDRWLIRSCVTDFRSVGSDRRFGPRGRSSVSWAQKELRTTV